MLGKADASPVTEADQRAEAHITPALQALAPGVPVVAEEAVSRGEAPELARRFWLVDPLDGTREFVSRNGEFTVNIALVEDGLPVLGVVFVPAQDLMYAGVVGQGAWVEQEGRREAMACVPAPPDGLRLASSRSHGDEPALQAWLAGRGGGEPARRGLVAEVRARGARPGRRVPAPGPHDGVGHRGRPRRAARRSGEVRDLQGAVLRYGKPGFENPHFRGLGPRLEWVDARPPPTRKPRARAHHRRRRQPCRAGAEEVPDRRLYDTQTSSYITLADVKQMVLDGAPFEVRDAKTAEDLTRSILLQIILEEESGGVPMFSAATLAQIIRFYGHAMQGVMGAMLEQNMTAFTEMQKQFVANSTKFSPDVWTQLLRAQPNAMQSMMDSYAEQSRQVIEKMQAAGSLFPGMAGMPGMPGFPPAKK